MIEINLNVLLAILVVVFGVYKAVSCAKQGRFHLVAGYSISTVIVFVFGVLGRL